MAFGIITLRGRPVYCLTRGFCPLASADLMLTGWLARIHILLRPFFVGEGFTIAIARKAWIIAFVSRPTCLNCALPTVFVRIDSSSIGQCIG